jgi:hypothetical protein
MSMTCQSTKKEMHLSRGKAEAHLRNLQERYNYIGVVYPCEYCGGWHVGREKDSVHVNKYKGVSIGTKTRRCF